MTSFEFPRIIDRIQVGKGPTGIHPHMPLVLALSQLTGANAISRVFPKFPYVENSRIN